MKPACGNVPHATDSDQKTKVKNPEQVCSTTVDLQEGLNVNTTARLNLKNHSTTQQHSYTKNEEAYFIPTIINRQIARKDTS
jgi:hypothetical protein